jgi:hypothetical protein
MEWAIMLLPLAVYLLLMGLAVNRRARPLAVRGSRNMAGVLVALSGFLLFGPFTWVAHGFRDWGPTAYWLAYSGYLLVLGLVCGVLIRRQRNSLVLYNTPPPLFADLLQDVLNELAIPYTATPGRIAFAQGSLTLDIDSSLVLNNVTLRWRGREPELRQRIEARLLEELRQVDFSGAGSSAASSLLILAALALLAFIVFAVGLNVLFSP